MAKSPVYGLGRNKKHRPRGCLQAPSAANVNLHGKKHKVMGCYCCYCIDFRAAILKRIHKQEMLNIE